MSRVIQFSTEDDMQKRRREATDWVIKLDNGDLTEEERFSLKNWLKEDERNVTELKRLSAFWDKISAVGNASHPPVSKQTSSKLSSSWVYKAAAGFLIMLFIPLTIYLQHLSGITSTNGEYLTKVGEQRTVKLSDGSEIILNTNSLVKVEISPSERNLELIRGEANFDVADDKSRPFVVRVGGGDVIALGTSFSIHKRANDVNVLVSHGTVKVTANAVDNLKRDVSLGLNVPEPASEKSVVVGAGKEVLFDDVQVESVISATYEDMSKKLYWKKGFLAFDDESLANVASELSRYTDMKIVIMDQDIKELRVGGYYPIDNLENVFTSLELNLGLKVKKVGQSAYYIMKS